MKKRAINFSAGPAILPEAVLKQAAEEMLCGCQLGISTMEYSHRSEKFDSILRETKDLLREVLAIPESFEILFMQGGARALNAAIPMNLLHRPGCEPMIDALETGVWSQVAISQARAYGTVNVVASSSDQEFTYIPKQSVWSLSSRASYLHICSNETIDGNQIKEDFHMDPTVVADMSSDILSRPIDFSSYGLIFASAQKNLGIAGLTVVIVRRNLLGYAIPQCPHVWNFEIVAQNDSRYNTPPTYAIYMAGLVLQWIKKQGGVIVMQKKANERASLLYDAIDHSHLFENRVSLMSRSNMNVIFYLKKKSLTKPFLEQATQRGLLHLAGHRLKGGIRASLYNAMPQDGVMRLIQYMKDFERQQLDALK